MRKFYREVCISVDDESAVPNTAYLTNHPTESINQCIAYEASGLPTEEEMNNWLLHNKKPSNRVKIINEYGCLGN